METSVIIPEDLFRQAEDLAASLGISRDQLYAQALAEFINQQTRDAITERLNEVYAENSSDLDEVLKRLQYASLPAEEG